MNAPKPGAPSKERFFELLYRLVRQSHDDYDSNGVKVSISSWYVLQVRDHLEAPWRTVPVVSWEEITQAERDEILQTLKSKTENNNG